MRAKMSLRAGKPNIDSSRSISPAALLSSVVTAHFIGQSSFSVSPAASGSAEAVSSGAWSAAGSSCGAPAPAFTPAGRGASSGTACLTASLISTQPPLAPGTAPRTRIRPRPSSVRDHLQVLSGHPVIAQVPGHLLALEDLAGVLAVTGRTMGTMADRHAVAGPETAKVVPLHGTRKALTNRGPDNVDILPGHKVRRRTAPTRLRSPNPRETRNSASFRLGSTLALAKCPRMATADVLDLGLAEAELNGIVAVALIGPHIDDLAAVQLKGR